ncbi:hypothetical protein [Streptomyces sp. NPDC002057]|uniref:hypothetical protein n=1 Tax=Streptomyces sp. NPDC002057 TaxID=3154664 RepID=UPI003331474A
MHRTLGDTRVRAVDLLAVRRPGSPPPSAQIRSTVALALEYSAAWLRGRGAVADGPREGTAAAEPARARLWQWRRQRMVTSAELRELIDTECTSSDRAHPGRPLMEAREFLERAFLSDELPPFLTTEAYRRHLISRTAVPS